MPNNNDGMGGIRALGKKVAFQLCGESSQRFILNAAGGTIVAARPPLRVPVVVMWTAQTPLSGNVRSNPPGISVCKVAVKPGGPLAALTRFYCNACRRNNSCRKAAAESAVVVMWTARNAAEWQREVKPSWYICLQGSR